MKQRKAPGKQPQNRIFSLCLLGILYMVLAGCRVSLASQSVETPTGESATVTPLMATQTPPILPTNTPTPWQPLTEGTGIPAEVPVLSVENITGLQVLGSWGDGIAYDMQWSPDGNWLAISTSRALLFIDPHQMTLVKRIALDLPIYHLSFVGDGSFLLAGGAQGKFYRYDLAGETLDELSVRGNAPITALTSGHNRPVMAAADWKAAVRLVALEGEYKVSDLLTTLQGSQALGFSADDKKIFTWSAIEPIKRWNVATQKMEQEIFFGLDANQKTGSQVRFSGDGTYAVINQTWQVRVQNLEDGTTLGLFSGFTQPVLDTAISSDGAFVFTLMNDKIQVWESKKSKVVGELSLAEGNENPRLMRLSMDNGRLVLLGNALTLFTWNPETRLIEEATSLPLVLASAGSFRSPSLSGNELGFALVDGTFLRFNLVTGTYTYIPGLSQTRPVVAINGWDGISIQAYADRTLQMVQADNAQGVIKIRGLSQPAVQLLLAPESGLLAAQTQQQLSGLWNLADGTFVNKQAWDVIVERLVFSADEKSLIASGGGKTQVYDRVNDLFSEVIEGRYLAATQQGMLLERYAAIDEIYLEMVAYDSPTSLHQIPAGARQAVFNLDGTLLVIGGQNLEIWDLVQDQKILTIANPAPSAELYFSEDGRGILLAAADGSVIFLGVPPSE